LPPTKSFLKYVVAIAPKGIPAAPGGLNQLPISNAAVAAMAGFTAWRTRLRSIVQMQAHWFGAGRSPGILATKTLVDQFLYTPFLSNPMQTLAFLWKSEQFSFRRTVEKMRQFRQFYVLTVLPVLVSNWLFWIPMVLLIYCFPTSLQLPLGILACAIWSMLLTALVEPADARGTSTEGLPGKFSASDSAEPERV
jgi:hypothetical protein